MKFTSTAAVLSVLASISSAQLLCTTNTHTSPALADCQKAFDSLPLPTGGVEPCLKIYAPRWTLAEAGSCKIEGYSSVGGAACLGRKEVRAAAQQVLKKCHLAGENVEGGAEIAAATKGVFQGVRVIAATPEE